MSPPPPPTTLLPYTEHLTLVQRQLRDALAALLASVGADPRQPQELSRRFGLNHTTSWKVCKIIQEADPQTLIQHMPGASGSRILFRALEKNGAPRSAVEAAEAAVAEFERMIQVHAGDRPTLERMAASQDSPASRQQREAHRKMSFRGNSCTWGVQADVQVRASILAPSQTPGMVDYASVGGLTDFRRLRHDAAWPMYSTSVWSDDPGNVPKELAIDAEFEREAGFPLLEEFSSQPAPKLRRVHEAGEKRTFELGEGPVGITGSITCLFGQLTREIGSIYRSPENLDGSYVSLLSTPVELFIGDLFIHRDLEFALDLDTALHSRLRVQEASGFGARTRLPLDDELTPLGCPPDLTTPEIPQYSRMIQWVFERLGWDLADFHGKRLRVAYPPIPSQIVFRHDLLDPDTAG